MTRLDEVRNRQIRGFKQIRYCGRVDQAQGARITRSDPPLRIKTARQ